MGLKEKLKNIIFKIKEFLWNDVPYRYSTYLSFIHTIAWLYVIFILPIFMDIVPYRILIQIPDIILFMILFIIPTMILFAIYIIFFILEFKIKRIKRNKFIDNRFIKIVILLQHSFFILIALFYSIFLIYTSKNEIMEKILLG